MKKILLVDDEPDAIEFILAMLEDLEGIEIDSATDGETALKKIRENIPDVVILDVQMPGISGFDVFTELRKDDATKALPVIMLTGVSEKIGVPLSSDDMGEFLGVKPDAFIEKPVEAKILQETVSKVLGL